MKVISGERKEVIGVEEIGPFHHSRDNTLLKRRPKLIFGNNERFEKYIVMKDIMQRQIRIRKNPGPHIRGVIANMPFSDCAMQLRTVCTNSKVFLRGY